VCTKLQTDVNLGLTNIHKKKSSDKKQKTLRDYFNRVFVNTGRHFS
jgi:hypothetical protein